MLLELVKGSELWVVLPDGTNLRVDCPDDAPAVVEHWHEGAVHQVMSLETGDTCPAMQNGQNPSFTENQPCPDKQQTRA